MVFFQRDTQQECTPWFIHEKRRRYFISTVRNYGIFEHTVPFFSWLLFPNDKKSKYLQLRIDKSATNGKQIWIHLERSQSVKNLVLFC